MDALLNVKPGLVFWTLFNFIVFLLVFVKLFGKPIINGLKNREEAINAQIENAALESKKAQELLKESQSKIENAQLEVAELIHKGKEQAEVIIRKANDEADKIRKEKLEEALKEIERKKEFALKQLRTEVADLVVNATEKLINTKLNKDQDLKLIETYIDNLPKN